MTEHSISTLPFPQNEPVTSFFPGSSEKKSLKAEIAKQQNLNVEIPLVVGESKIMNRPKSPLVSPHEKARVLAQVSQATAQDCQSAIKSALKAREYWSNLPWEDRAAVFLKAADLLTSKYRDQINAATMLAQSKTCHQSEIDVICELADFLRFNAYYAEKIYREQPVHSPRGIWNRMEARPLEGFVFAIGPFNFTSIAMNLATTPALMGVPVVWKPAHQSLLPCHYLLELLSEAGLPPGVINLLSGDHRVIGEQVINHREMAGIHFTGSTNTFDTIWVEVGKNLNRYKQYPRLVGETGGKDFILAHESADPKALITAMIRGSFEYQGQKRSASSRAFIAKSVWKKIKDELIETTKSIRMGDVSDFRNFMGAVIDEGAFEKISGYLTHANQSPQVKVLCGGEADKSVGYFIRPTILEATDPSYKTMVEEIFGPVLTVYVYEENDLDKILELIDSSTPYALTGAIFATDRRVVKNLTDRLAYAAGNFYINDKPTGAVVGQQPFGGARRSGTNDKAGSMYNLLRWTSHRTIKENLMTIEHYGYPFMGES